MGADWLKEPSCGVSSWWIRAISCQPSTSISHQQKSYTIIHHFNHQAQGKRQKNGAKGNNTCINIKIYRDMLWIIKQYRDHEIAGIKRRYGHIWPQRPSCFSIAAASSHGCISWYLNCGVKDGKKMCSF